MKGKFAQSCPTLCDPYSLWTVACQAPLSIEFSRPEYWSGYPIPSPGDLPDPRNQTRSPALQADSLPAELPGDRRIVQMNLFQVRNRDADIENRCMTQDGGRGHKLGDWNLHTYTTMCKSDSYWEPAV